MNEPMTVTCDQCKEEFPGKPRERKVPGGALMFLRCPACHAEYPILRITEKGLRLRRLIRQARAKLPKGRAKFDRLLEEFDAETSKPTP